MWYDTYEGKDETSTCNKGTIFISNCSVLVWLCVHMSRVIIIFFLRKENQLSEKIFACERVGGGVGWG
jgi:hypothetical protein